MKFLTARQNKHSPAGLEKVITMTAQPYEPQIPTDRHTISPYNINKISNIRVIRIKKIINTVCVAE